MSKLSSSRRVGFSSDQGSTKPPTAAAAAAAAAASFPRNKKRVIAVFWVFRLPKSGRFSPGKFLRRLGAKVAKVLGYVSLRKRSTTTSSLPANNSRKGFANNSNFNRSHSVSDSMEESHRAEAVKDCIQFFNSSSSSSSSSAL